VNPLLAIGQILVSFGLIAAILLQARGTGLSGTFGGDSAVYRSRLVRRLLVGLVHPRPRRGVTKGRDGPPRQTQPLGAR